ncbi:MAG TPA: carbon-nitrogen hydrolase family protein [Thermoleophilaceae bacterium]|nr:carbon-nitrogen hydrolase family protein [Thermoleophilaceae bacterium]
MTGGETLRAAAVQLNSTDDKDRNLATADRLVRAAAQDGADLVVLPEKFNLLGSHEDYTRGAESLEGRTISWAAESARELGIDLVAGSIVEQREGREKLGNTSVHVGPDGEVKAVYRKIHMFDVEVGGQVYRESDSEDPGDEIVLSETGNGLPLGLTVCYDLRFPELFRILAVEGARIVTLPAAFTKVTGQAHWEILIRARAIENQAFMVAADQVGRHPEDKESFGGSMIVDPWGEVLARAPDEECFVAADLDLERQDEVRHKLPSLANRMPAAYRRPQKAGV